MQTAHAIVLVAQDLFRRLGADGHALVAARAQALDSQSEPEPARFWRRVGLAMRLMDAAPNSVSEKTSATRARAARRRTEWLLMQRIEGFRHLATAAERQALAAPAEGADDLRSIAVGWRDLASELEGLIASQGA
jgi:hypothetical protein